MRLFSCGKGPAGATQAWAHDAASKKTLCVGSACLRTSAKTARDLRVNVTAAASSTAAQGWSFDDESGLVTNAPSGLCLAARQEGIYNRGS